MFDSHRTLLAIQAAAAVLILAFAPGNMLKLLAFALLWAITFRRLSSRELLCFIGASALFSVLDVMAVRAGVFAFSHGDIAGLPLWEYFMWGFYVLHVLRMLDGPIPSSRLHVVLPLAVLFALPFSAVANPDLLLAASAFALAVALVFFHERWDLLYVVYTLLLGALIEYAGVWSGQWYYPANPPGGVAFWFATMWGGVGLFIRRLVLPLVAEPTPAARSRIETPADTAS